MHADFNLIKEETFKLQLMKQANGFMRIDKQVLQTKSKIDSGLYIKTYCFAVKSGDRFSDEEGVLFYE